MIDNSDSNDIRLTVNSEIERKIVYDATDKKIQNILNGGYNDVIRNLYTSQSRNYLTYQESYENFKFLTDQQKEFSFQSIQDGENKTVKESYLSNCISTTRLLNGYPNEKLDKNAYKDEDGQFYGLLSSTLERNCGIFLYISDNTSFNADDRVFVCEQGDSLGRSSGSSFLAIGSTGKLFQMGYRLRWDENNATYRTYSSKSAYDAYRFLLEKTGLSSSEQLNDPLYLFYGKTSDGREITEYGSFSAKELLKDSSFIKKVGTFGGYASYLVDKVRKYVSNLRYEQSKCITSISEHKKGFYSKSKFAIDKQLDTLESLRTGLWYSSALCNSSLMQISENTGIPIIFHNAIFDIQTTEMPNNMEQIKWQPTEANKLYECYKSLDATVDYVLGGYESTNALRDYFITSGCILGSGLDSDFFDITGEKKRTTVWDVELYVCLGTKCLKRIMISKVLQDLGIGQLYGSSSVVAKACTSVTYLNSITYKGGQVESYNNVTVTDGKNWWDKNLDRVRTVIKDEITSVLGTLTVTFQDHNGTVLKVQKNVKTGSNAIPPENPTREGYNFTKWEPSFTNVTCDLTCIAQYEKIYVPQPKGNNIRNQMTKAKLSKNILSVGDYCFYNCHKLKDVELGPYCRMIGTSAFKDCTSLSSVNRLNDSNLDHTFDIVGDYAFSNTNISSVTLVLRGSSSFTFFGDYCFAYNNSLQNVRFLSSSFMSNNMFCDCSSLTSVTFDNNYTSYVYPYVFHNCTALRDITLPSKIWFLTNGMFKGCSSLSSIKFSSYDSGATNLIQDGAFNGCSSLTSIEFPQSINSLSCLEDGCFQNMQNLREIKFDGIISDDLMINGTVEVIDDIYYGVRYEKKKNTDVLKLIEIADKMNVPIVIACRKTTECSKCLKFGGDIKSKEGIADLIKHKIVMIDYVNCLYTNDKVDALFKQGDTEGDVTSTGYVIYGIYWRKQDGILKKYRGTGISKWVGSLNEKVEKVLDSWGYDWKMTEKEKAFQTTTTVDSIKKTGCFRLNHDCTLISKEGATVNFKYNPNEVEQKIEEPNYESDKITKTDFQVGKWYYNMKQLKQYADSTQKPILGIYSLLGCDPCAIYRDNIWNNHNLQSWISSQNFYFCGIESQRQLYYDDQLRYCVQDFVISANNYLRYGDDEKTVEHNAFGEYFKETKNETTGQINTNLFTPVIMMYDPTNRVNSNGNFYLYTYHNIQKWIDKCGKDGVVEVLKRLCLYHFENNDTSSPNGFVKGVTVKFDINNLPSKEEEYEKNKYYDENTGIMNLGSYGSLEKLKLNLKSTFRDENGDYIGGCQVEQVPWMYEIGINAEIATNYPEELKEILESVKTYRFTDTDEYTVTLDITDTEDVYSPCSMSGIETGYRLMWIKQ